MATTDIAKAVLKRGEAKMLQEQRRGRAIKARYDARTARVVLDLDSGLSIAFESKLAEGLAGASARDLSDIEITPSGLGLHWPRLDADLYLPALLNGLLGSKKWVAAKLGAAGGRARSRAKAASSRENGKRGGRPRKVAAG
ncbi:MAG: DUF2442 domain-containing protein [Rudaea sp.]